MTLNCIAALLSALVVSLIIMPFVIKMMRRLKFGQTILHYVDNQQSKNGTPTMGGVGFLIAFAACSLIFMANDRAEGYIIVAVTLGYGIVGFLDDFIKVKFHRNEGLTALQKIIFQLAIATIVSVYAYLRLGTSIYGFISGQWYDLKWFAIPLYIVTFLAFTNSVNLTDGLDGLASETSVAYLLGFCCVWSTILTKQAQASDLTNNMLICSAALGGSILGFICYNCNPARIFMGDTGSLAIGGFAATLTIFSGQALLSMAIGIMFVMSSLSVIMQVAYYKSTHKRIFRMAPLHHHFERGGVPENRIVKWYVAVTLISSAIAFILVSI